MKQYNLIADKIEGRKILLRGHGWVSDFASCNYLGLDLHPEIASLVSEEINNWGGHPSWCRLVASPKIFDDLEIELAHLIGTETTMILPTVTLISIGVLPALVGKTGVLILDKAAHETMYEAAKIARDNGATLTSYTHGDLEALEAKLAEHRNNPRKVVMVDGVYSMSGNYADIPALQKIAKQYDAIIYIDDAHGFGVIGERPSEELPYGYRGNGVVRRFDCSYDNLIYVGGCSKAYSALAAFVGCSSAVRDFLRAFATPYDLSGPAQTASLAILKAGLRINEREGDLLRTRLWRNTSRVKSALTELGFFVENTTGFPILTVRVGDNDLLRDTANTLLDKGVLVTVAPYPMVRKGEEGHRLSITAANTDEDIDRLSAAFADIRDKVVPTYGRS